MCPCPLHLVRPSPCSFTCSSALAPVSFVRAHRHASVSLPPPLFAPLPPPARTLFHVHPSHPCSFTPTPTARSHLFGPRLAVVRAHLYPIVLLGPYVTFVWAHLRVRSATTWSSLCGLRLAFVHARLHLIVCLAFIWVRSRSIMPFWALVGLFACSPAFYIKCKLNTYMIVKKLTFII